MKAVLAVLSLGIVCTACGLVLAQNEPTPKRDSGRGAIVQDPETAEPLAGNGGAVLGEPFESVGLGVALRGPAGARVIRQVGGTQVDFVNEKKKWNLKVARLNLEQPMPLESSKDADGARKVGLLEVTLDRLKDQLPGATVLRDDVVKIGKNDVGMIALRYVKGLETLLSQQALVHAGDRTYFTLTLTSPGSKASGNEAGDDPGEREAVETFGEVLDTLRLIDQTPLVRDQSDRVYASLAVLVNLGGKGRLESKLIPRQWFRVQRNGKDLGYVYTVEEMADGIPGDTDAALRPKKANRRAGPDGILVGTRARTTAGDNGRADAESWMFCGIDRRTEEWSTLQVTQDLKDPANFDHKTIVGSSSWRSGVKLDRRAHEQGFRGEIGDPNQPPVRQTNDHVLNVTHASKRENFDPLAQSLPDYYLPQALSHLLPRLLPVDQPKKYLFAVYVPEVRAVMHRYVDVGEEKKVTFAGEAMRAVPISDRIGLEGSVTTHYMSFDGKYLGSENADTGIVVLPSSEAKLLEIWKDADLTRPADRKGDAKAAAATNPAVTPAAANAAAPAVAPATGLTPQAGEHPPKAAAGKSRLDRRNPSSR